MGGRATTIVALLVVALASSLGVANAADGASRQARSDLVPRASKQQLMPGVSYERTITFTSHGPVVMHVLTMPRPGGLYSLRTVLSNETMMGREKVTAMEQRLSSASTVAGVNGDLFNWREGTPSGILMRGGALDSSPIGQRTSVGVTSDGSLQVGRIAYVGSWQGSGQRRALKLNVTKAPNGVVLYTPAWGATTPAQSDSYEVVLQPFPPSAPGADLLGTVVSTKSGGGTPIPPDGAVLVGRGSQAPKLLAEAPVGQSVIVRLTLTPLWPGLVEAIGGGPVIVRQGSPVFQANEAFTADQLFPRNPRTGVGQTASGKIILVAVDGRQPGYSTGVTAFELAQAMVQLGCVTASALDAGGSTTMAFDGQLLNQPSDPAGERPIADALMLFYDGIYAPVPTESVLSPNGDGVAEAQALSYKIVRPSTVSISLIGPDGLARVTDSGLRDPGRFDFQWNGKRADDSPEQEGIWKWIVSGTDDQGRPSSMVRQFALDNTLGYLTAPDLVRLNRRSGGSAVISFTLTRSVKTALRIYNGAGVLLRTMALKNPQPGQVTMTWNGKDAKGRVVRSGPYEARVAAVSPWGRSELRASFAVRRIG